MAHIGPVLDRSLIDDVYACRTGKGVVRAALRVQRHMRRAPWYAQIDIRHYFPTIDHGVLMERLERKFSDHDVLRLMGRIISAHQATPGRGLPIGALTSQNFANFYLSTADRMALEQNGVAGYVRYMDDLVWWGPSKSFVRDVLRRLTAHIEQTLKLTVKNPVKIGQSRHGVAFCGFRILPDRLLLSRRRKKRFVAMRRDAENAFENGAMSAAALQQRMDCALAVTAHADAAAWRRAQLGRRPLSNSLLEV